MPQDPFELLQKAEMLFDMGNNRDALELLSHAEQLALENERPDALAPIYGTIGNILWSMGNFENARKYLEQALKILEQLAGIIPFFNANVWIAQAQFQLGDLLHDMKRHEDAIYRYEQALNMYEALLNTYPENIEYQLYVAMTQDNLGIILRHMGRHKEAKFRYEQALNMYEALLNIYPENAKYQSNVARTQYNLGNLLRDMERHKEAKFRYEQALNMYEALLNTEPENVKYQSGMAGTLNNFGLLLRDMGKFERAKIKEEQALKMREALANKYPEKAQYQSDVAMTQGNLGSVLQYMGRLEEAKIIFKQALKFYETQLETVPENFQYQFEVAGIKKSLGVILDDMGKFEEAKDTSEQALAIFKSLLNREPKNTKYLSEIAGTQGNLGNLLIDMGRLEEAKNSFVQALNIREALREKDPENMQYQLNVATSQNDLGNLLKDMGLLDEDDKVLEDAKVRYEQALEIYETWLKKYPENMLCQLYVAMTQDNLGTLLSHMNRSEDAKIMYEQALKMREALLNTDSENAGYQSDVAMSQSNLGRLLQDQGNFSRALDYHTKAINLVSTSGDPSFIFKLFGARGRCYEKMGNFDYAYEDYKESIERIEHIRSLLSLEEYKLDILWDKTNVYSYMISLLYTKMNDIEKAWEYVGRVKSRILLDYLRFVELPVSHAIPKDLQSKEKELLESIRTLDNQARTAKKADQKSLLLKEVTKLQYELNKLYDQIIKFAPQYVDLRRGEPLTIGEITGLLEKQSKKTAFIEYYITHDKVFIFVMNSEKKKPKVKIVDLSFQDLNELVNTYIREVIYSQQMPGIEESWYEAAEQLISPVLKDIDGCEMLYLIPHGYLHLLPLHALYINGKRLIELFPITYAPSLSVIKYAQLESGEKLDSCISMGFTPKEDEKELFEGEASLVADLFKIRPYLDNDVTKKLFAEEVVNMDVIHVSCHGYYSTKGSLNSGLLLSDGMLTVKDIFNMNIKANLLVLSACQTGLNVPKPGDEMIGLTRAFLYSGTKSIMVSLWSVSSDSTLKLMESFYKKIKNEKMNKAEALQKAQIEMIQDEQYSHPYYWAPFILIGDWK